MSDSKRPHVVVIGGGFGGLSAVRALDGAKVDITVLDRTNHHLFQPLLYQVAMAGLSPAEIAWPIRTILSKQRNAKVVLAEVVGVSLDRKTVTYQDGDEIFAIQYDYLVLATGAKTTYFGHDEWEKYAIGLKDLDEAVEIRRRVLLSFEAAERSSDPDERRRLLTFAVIGAGPTGVELAGAIAELSRSVLARDYRSINPKATRVTLVEAGDRVLAAFDPKLSASALEQLGELNVDVKLKTKVTNVDARGVHLEDGTVLETGTVIWAAGVGATSLTRTLGVELDRGGRVVVEPDCSIPGHNEAFAIGDMALLTHQGGKPLPGVSPVAMQQGRFVARQIKAELAGKRAPETFHYVDKGSMATIGRSRAIAEIGKIRLSGFIAWMAWLVVHIFFLIGFRNRFAVLFNWAYQYFAYQRGARIITGRRLSAGQPVDPAPQQEFRASQQ
jgi:NADH dehydrogenase